MKNSPRLREGQYVHPMDEGMEPFDQDELESTKQEEKAYVKEIIDTISSLR